MSTPRCDVHELTGTQRYNEKYVLTLPVQLLPVCSARYPTSNLESAGALTAGQNQLQDIDFLRGGGAEAFLNDMREERGLLKDEAP